MKNIQIILSIGLIVLSGALSAQDCKKAMKKEKDGRLQTKDQELDRILVESHRIGFMHRNGKYYLEYFKTNQKPSAGLGSLGDAAMTNALIDTVVIEFSFSGRDEITYKFSSGDSELGGFSVKGTALTHYYCELSEEDIERFTKEQVKKYRMTQYNKARESNLDDKKWKVVKPGNGDDIRSVARCIVKEAG